MGRGRRMTGGGGRNSYNMLYEGSNGRLTQQQYDTKRWCTISEHNGDIARDLHVAPRYPGTVHQATAFTTPLLHKST